MASPIETLARLAGDARAAANNSGDEHLNRVAEEIEAALDVVRSMLAALNEALLTLSAHDHTDLVQRIVEAAIDKAEGR